MWNDTDIPIAFLVTFRTYGTWLHGDVRGSVNRDHNIHGTPMLPENKAWQKINRELLSHDPVLLNAAMRNSVDASFEETCEIRGWKLYAKNVRTNHCHIVLQADGVNPSKVLHALKANATRQMRSDQNWKHSHSPWVSGGSTKWLWRESSLDLAIDYVLYGQCDDLPNFD